MNLGQVFGVGLLLMMILAMIGGVLFGIAINVADAVRNRGGKKVAKDLLKISAVIAGVILLWFTVGYIGHEILGMEVRG